MKKSLSLLVLGIGAAVSLAFYHRTDGPTTQHLLLSVRYEHTPTSGGLLVPSLNLVGADGPPRVLKLALRGTVHAQLNALHQAEAARLDSLGREGWLLAATWTNHTSGAIVETTHLLTQGR